MIKKFLHLAIFSTILSASDTVSIDGLEWQDDSAAKTIKKNHEGAISYCDELSFAGKNDWRLPSIKEFQTIIDITRYKPAIKNDFKNIIPKIYWSSSLEVLNSKRAWYVDFESGEINGHTKRTKHYVRCVR